MDYEDLKFQLVWQIACFAIALVVLAYCGVA